MKKKDNEGKTIYSTDEQEEDALLTPWSFVHYMSGAAMRDLGFSFPVAFGVHAIYELKDRQEHEEGVVYNSMLNSVGDQGAAMLGWYWTKRDPSLKHLWYFAAAYLAAVAMKEDIG